MAGRGATAAVIGALCALALAACSSEAPTLTGAIVAKTTEASAVLSLSPEEVAQQGPAFTTTPFGDPAATQAGGREVIAQPTKAEILSPSGLPELVWGSPDAPVTIVEYASLTCPFCKRFHADVYPTLKRDYIDTGKVRYILRDFPIGRQSGQASVALRCAAPDKAIDLFGRFLVQQPSWVSQEVRIDPIAAVAAQAGVTRAAYDACRSDVALVEGIKAMKDRGRKLGVIGTPNFFINEKLVKKALDLANLQAMIDPLIAAPTASAQLAQ
jgi:protein-disulfide isomerase